MSRSFKKLPTIKYLSVVDKYGNEGIETRVIEFIKEKSFKKITDTQSHKFFKRRSRKKTPVFENGYTKEVFISTRRNKFISKYKYNEVQNELSVINSIIGKGVFNLPVVISGFRIDTLSNNFNMLILRKVPNIMEYPTKIISLLLKIEWYKLIKKRDWLLSIVNICNGYKKIDINNPYYVRDMKKYEIIEIKKGNYKFYMK